MKKSFFFLIICATFFLFSYKDYGACTGTNGQKALACSSCHGGSIVQGVFIDGRDDEENDYVVSVRIPNSDLAYLQISTEAITNTVKPELDVNLATLIKDFKGSSLFSAINLTQKSVKISNGFIETDIYIHYNEAISEPQEFVIQGVLSNMDGTSSGDKTFYSKFTIQPKNKTSENISEPLLLESFSKSYYFNNTIYIQEENSIISIYDLQGKLVHQELFLEKGSTSLTFLPSGMYFVKGSINGLIVENYAFTK
jgi:hypothetical protein